MITQFDLAAMKSLRSEINEALNAIAEKHGIALELGSGTYAEGHASFKLKCSVKTTSGQVITKEYEDFQHYAHLFGLKPENLGSTFKLKGQTFEVCGLNTRARNMPVIARDLASGKSYKFAAEDVRRLLALA